MFKNLILTIMTVSLISFNVYAGSDGELTLNIRVENDNLNEDSVSSLAMLFQARQLKHQMMQRPQLHLNRQNLHRLHKYLGSKLQS